MDIVHVRVEFQGTGHFQESVFLTAVDGNLVRLRMDDETEKPIREFYVAHRIEQFHRGLGFCEGRLVEQRLFEAGSAPCIGCRVEIRYGVNRSRLTVNRIAFTKIPESDKDCEMFPRR